MAQSFPTQVLPTPLFAAFFPRLKPIFAFALVLELHFTDFRRTQPTGFAHC
jgi:hypothetical protein